MKDIKIVIVNYNMKSEISACIMSLLKEIERSKLNCQIVVVDNDSNDGSRQELPTKFSMVKFVDLDKNLGFGAAQNIGLKSGEPAKYCFVLNPDTFFFDDQVVLRSMFDFLESRPSIGMIGPKVVYPDGSLQFSCYRFPTFLHPFYTRANLGTQKSRKYQNYLAMKDVEHNEVIPVDWIMGSAMFIRGSSLEKVGAFDERFWMYYEDSDLCRRFWENNIPVYYYPEVKIQHIHHRGSASENNIIKAFALNKLARVHIFSWIKYMWKWRGNLKYYATKI